jgi:hypothetical protein
MARNLSWKNNLNEYKALEMTKNVIFSGKLSIFRKIVIFPKLINILKFGFDYTKSHKIYYKKTT